MAEPRFTFTGLSFPGDEDPLGIWELDASQTAFAAQVDAAAAAEATASVAPQAGTAEPSLIWRVELPAAREDAESHLRTRLAATEACREDLAAAEKRLADLNVGLAYSGQSAGPESALLAEVMSLRGDAAAYGAVDAGPISILHLYEQCEALIDRFRGLVKYYARVETSVGGKAVAITVVDWSGDYDVTWQDGVGTSDMALHMDAVRLALASRQAWLGLVSVVASGALSLSIKASVPGGQFLLFPAVYQFVVDVLAELEQVEANQEALG